MNLDAAQLDVWTKVTQLIGIPVAIGVYYFNKRRERLDREYGTYNALDERYISYLELCLQHPDLDVADTPKPNMPVLSTDQEHKQRILFTILVSIMERAFLMYSDKSDRIRSEQWDGWSDYIRDWCSRPNFANALPGISNQFDKRFCRELEKYIGRPLKIAP